MPTITAIEGIADKKAEKLRAVGIRTTEALLERGATRKGRAAVVAEAKITEKQCLEWVNRADLMRVKGISSRYSDLLEAAGVDTVKELKRRKAANLCDAMEATNNRRKNKLVQRCPSAKVIQKWIDQAKVLPAVVKY